MKQITIVNSIEQIKQSNAVLFLQKSQDIDMIRTFVQDDNFIKKLECIIEEKKSTTFSTFLGYNNFESIYVFYSPELSTEKCIDFLGKELLQIPKNYTLFISSNFHVDTLLDTCILRRYRFEQYRSQKSPDIIYVLCPPSFQKYIETRLITLENISFARDLGEMPSNILTPKEFVKQIQTIVWKNTKITVLSPKDIEDKKLGFIQAVGNGSENKPCIVLLEKIQDKTLPTYALIGKGITFDTGGNQVKPGDTMYDMKGDMGGAAVCLSIMKELDEKQLSINIISCLCLAENSISGSSYRPSDIITGYAGKTVEVIHTDAEGRLILADGISYVSKNYKVENIVTIATLTGAVIGALGWRYAGIMGNDQHFIDKILEYSKSHTEKYIQLPFDEYFISKTKSEIADYKNLDKSVMAGSSMGGAFLYNFVENQEKFVHIDIAGTFINGGEAYGKNPKGMTGFGVDSLSFLLQNLK